MKDECYISGLTEALGGRLQHPTKANHMLQKLVLCVSMFKKYFSSSPWGEIYVQRVQRDQGHLGISSMIYYLLSRLNFPEESSFCCRSYPKLCKRSIGRLVKPGSKVQPLVCYETEVALVFVNLEILTTDKQEASTSLHEISPVVIKCVTAAFQLYVSASAQHKTVSRLCE